MLGLFVCSLVAILTTMGIIFSLLFESLKFFSAIEKNSLNFSIVVTFKFLLAKKVENKPTKVPISKTDFGFDILHAVEDSNPY